MLADALPILGQYQGSCNRQAPFRGFTMPADDLGDGPVANNSDFQ